MLNNVINTEEGLLQEKSWMWQAKPFRSYL